MAEWVPQCGACGAKLSAKRMRRRRPRCAKCRQPYVERDKAAKDRKFREAAEWLSKEMRRRMDQEMWELMTRPSVFGGQRMQKFERYSAVGQQDPRVKASAQAQQSVGWRNVTWTDVVS